MAEIAYIALGSNLGDREKILSRARAAIGGIDGVELVQASRIEETEPVGPVSQGAFLNQMVSVTTKLSPRGLLSALQKIEQEEGRERTTRWGPRTLDLDIVLIEGVEFSDDVLTVPHRELDNRDFWQRELAELRGVNNGG
ncbi:MAG: 2-amino-4-hydroxy-6-hydroxymethyldihydropteridine diphosphokinase [Thermoanaerobaculia bacterium]